MQGFSPITVLGLRLRNHRRKIPIMIRDELASFASDLLFDSLPGSVVVEVKRVVLDHVASMLAGPRVFGPELPPLPALARARGGVAESSIVGVPGRYPCTSAAFTNTAMGFTGIDAWHKRSTLHVPAVMFSAAIAVAEREHASGRQLIEALVAGVEIMIRISEALGPRNLYERGFHPTSVCGAFGCAIAAGKLINLDTTRLAEAISTAAVQGAGSSIWAGASTPPTFLIQLGRASEGGVLAALLAGQGCYGVDRIFEDPRGFPMSYSGQVDPAKFTDALGETYRVKQIMMQRFWFGPLLLTAIESLIDLMREHELTASDIDTIEAWVPHTCLLLIGATEYPQNRLATETTLRYALAVVSHVRESALYSPEVSSSENRSDSEVRSLFERVRVEGDDELDRSFPGTESSIVRVNTRDGAVLTRRNDGPVRGEPEDPMSDAEIKAKFEVMATPVLTPGYGQKIIDVINHLEDLDDVNHLTSLWASLAP